jgi:hypothetical protein
LIIYRIFDGRHDATSSRKSSGPNWTERLRDRTLHPYFVPQPQTRNAKPKTMADYLPDCPLCSFRKRTIFPRLARYHFVPQTQAAGPNAQAT